MASRRRRRRRKNNNKLLKILILVICLAVFVTTYGIASGWYFPMPGFMSSNSEATNNNGSDNNNQSEANTADIEGFNVLMMGTDNRDTDGMDTRTDTMMLMNYNDEKDRISLLSIPRDTRVEIPGHWTDKINAANVYGGPELAVKTVSQFLDIPIDYYVLTNFYGFKDIVDALGGVEINVEQDMYRPGEESYGGKFGINLKKGEQVLDGDKALDYVRYRGGPDGDLGRTDRQLKFIKALASETMQAGTIKDLPQLVPAIKNNVKTNLGVSELYKLARAGKNLNSVDIKTQTLPGNYLISEDGINYWSVDKERAREIASALFREGKVLDHVVQGPTRDLRPEEEETEENVAKNESQEEENGDTGESSNSGESSGDAGRDGQQSGEQEGSETPSRGNDNDNESSGGSDAEESQENSEDSDSTRPEGLPSESDGETESEGEEEQSSEQSSNDSEDSSDVEIIIETDNAST